MRNVASPHRFVQFGFQDESYKIRNSRDQIKLGLNKFPSHAHIVDDFVSVKAPIFNRLQSTSTSGPQAIQRESTDFKALWNLVRDPKAGRSLSPIRRFHYRGETGCEVLPILTGRCVETPEHLDHSSRLAAASERITESCSIVNS